MPPMASSMLGTVLLVRFAGRATFTSLRELVPGLVYGLADRLAVERGGAGDRDRAGGQVDVDAGDALDPADLGGDRRDAVTARHALDRVASTDHLLSAFVLGYLIPP